MERAGKIIMIVAGVLLGICVVVIVGINLYMRLTFADFFARSTPEFEMPGMNSGFVIQDLAYLEDGDTFIFSGYMASGADPSPLYRRGADGRYTRFYLAFPGGVVYDGHGGGCSAGDGRVYVSCENGYLVFDESDILNAGEGDCVEAQLEVSLDFTPAFVTYQDGTLFVGEFYFEGVYETAGWEHITCPDGTENPAVMYAYSTDAANPSGVAEYPSAVYSIPAKVQGCCVYDGNKLVLSTSYALAPSEFFAYDLNALVEDGTFEVGRASLHGGVEVPLYCLDSRSLVDTVEAPPMAEGIIYHDGRIWLTDEAASNKYIFGKLFGYFDVISFSL